MIVTQLEQVTAAFTQDLVIDVLVNSAGITGKTNIKSPETDPADVERVFRVNFFGSYFTSKAALPGMISRGYGRILHIASIAGKEGNAGMLAYSASKAAVIGMAKVQGKEVAGTGVTVNALAPAVIETPMVAAMPSEQVKYMTAKIPMNRCGSSEELVAMVEFIVSPACSFTTGFTFDLTGAAERRISGRVRGLGERSVGRALRRGGDRTYMTYRTYMSPPWWVGGMSYIDGRSICHLSSVICHREAATP